MDFWKILGIEATQDKDAITEAYHAQLSDTNPEDKPEEFRMLREAYEKALAEAEKAEGEQVKPDTPLTRWTAQIAQTYADLQARCSPERWQTLLDDPVCFSLGGRIAARDALLHFMMEHYFLPQKIWKQLDAFFDFHGNQQELYEKFPKDFIHYGVLNAVDYSEFIRFEEFTDTTGEACDAYITASNKFRRMVRNGTPEELDQAFAELEQVPAHHPHTELARAQYARRKDQTDEALAACSRYLAQCPQDEDGLLMREQLLTDAKRFAEAERDILTILQNNPGYNQAKYDLVCVLEGQQRYADAKELLQRLERQQPRNRVLSERSDHINTQLLPLLVEENTTHPENAVNAMELTWCYLQQDELELAGRTAESLPETLYGTYDYENLMSKLLLNQEKYVEALPHLEKWEQSIQTLKEQGAPAADAAPECALYDALPEMADMAKKPDGEAEAEQPQGEPDSQQTLAVSDEELKTLHARAHLVCCGTAQQQYQEKLVRMSEAMRLRGMCLRELSHIEEALAQMERTEKEYPEDAETFLAHAQMLGSLGRNAEAEQALDRFVQLRPEEGFGIYLRGIMRFRQVKRVPAWQDFLAAEHIYGKELNCMSYRCRILQDDDHWEDAEKILEELKKVPPEENLCLQYCRTRAQEKAAGQDEKKNEEVRAAYAALAEKLQGGATIERPGDVYYRYALCSENSKKYAEMETILKQGEEAQPNDLRLMDFLAYVQIKREHYADAEKTYLRMMAAQPDHPGPVDSLADLYRRQIRDYPKAAELYRKVLAMRETAEEHATLGKCLQEIEDWAGAEAEYRTAMKLDPEQPAFLANLGGLYMAQKNLDAAADQFRMALDVKGADTAFYMAVREQLAHVECRRKNYDAAQALWQQSVNAGNLNAMTDLAEVLENRGQYKQALQLLDEWKTRCGDKVSEEWYLRRRGEILEEDGNLREAIRTLEQAAATSASGACALASLYLNNGKYGRAISLLKKCVNAAPNKYSFLADLARAQWLAGKKTEAVATAQKALKALEARKPDLDRAMYVTKRAGILMLLGRLDEAAELLVQARIAPLCGQCIYSHCKDADWYEVLLREMEGNYEAAAELVRKGLVEAPEDTDFRGAAKRLRKKGVQV